MAIYGKNRTVFVIVSLCFFTSLVTWQKYPHKKGSEWQRSTNAISNRLIPESKISNSMSTSSKTSISSRTTVKNGTCNYLKFGDKCIPIDMPTFKTRLLVGVLSSSKNIEKRNSVRQTWKQYPGDWSLTFLIGLPFDQNRSMENATYGDLSLLHEYERYNGTTSVLPMKTSMLYWIGNHTSDDVEWLLKTDDDSFVDIPKLLNLTTHLKKPLYGGFVWTIQGPVRDPKSVSYISVKQWPRGFPHYASGSGYLVSKDLTTCFLSKIKHAVNMPREDVFSGVLAEKCKIKPTHLKNFSDGYNKRNDTIIAHEIKTFERMNKLWTAKNKLNKTR